ncbi:phosphoribosylglycinamide formyltransferase [Sulfurospirillum sp. T05]|uniref:Phosphoribosylglycinamide formyltransferase n=1 Tax=Sulfurospirillum tamanense TaxID=2813362 RepID=A0ABS2WTC9_9BACT|nr:phosphoribosylglycinamide formyltransferase [Sulfurospirillum tamanensis]MBN2964919.1 phosphoribosylglycinamide formyltransferase [Sulfurospirillum tamanensis]
MPEKRLAVLFSGKGSNLESLLRTLHGHNFSGTTLKVVLTLTNKPNAGGIEKSRHYGIEPVVIDHTQFESREAFDGAVVEVIQNAHVDLVVLAGFMRILTPVFTQQVSAINLHPSLLPLFKGANAIKESYEAKVKEAGVSVHCVSEELDGGAIVLQEAFVKEANMSYEAFEAKIRAIEHQLLPKAVIKLLC